MAFRLLSGSMVVYDQSEPEFPAPFQTRAPPPMSPPLSTATQEVAVAQDTPDGTLESKL